MTMRTGWSSSFTVSILLQTLPYEKDLQLQPTLTKSDIFTILPEAELILQGENVRRCISCRVYSDFDAVS